MKKILTVLHTGLTTVPVIGRLLEELLPPDVVVRNVVDDSLLIDTRKAGFMTEDVANRIVSYVKLAESHGSDCVLFACSSVGPAADMAREEVRIPVLKIDEPMAEAAVTRGPRIAILATVSTTLKPTRDLIEKAAKEQGAEVEIQTFLSDKAFDVLSAGNVAEHNRLLIGDIVKCASEFDVVVLAQASMTNILPELTEEVMGKVLTSPRLGVLRTAQVLEGLNS
ncbi:MAG: aspartate/glutamate racemase family protein [Bacillota bacterium]|nr:aspartate/glutamate racemase family protein [Candidatus Fermentithermobacillaceae bacterium]